MIYDSRGILIENGIKLLTLPVLSNIEEVDSWLYDLEIWQYVTDFDKKQRAPVIYISLSDNVRNAYRDILVANLDRDNRLDTLIV